MQLLLQSVFSMKENWKYSDSILWQHVQSALKTYHYVIYDSQ